MYKFLYRKEIIFLIFILLFGLVIRLYALPSQMHLISDQGWFFLSAKEIFETGKIPLIGITSSHTWLNQGPLWTYILAVILWLGKFNPLAAGYFSILLDVFTILVLYKVSKELFSKDIGQIASILYASSPLIIIHSRMPYHTSPIPILSILFVYFLYRFVKGNVIYFPLALFTSSLLYNFELATVLFPGVLFAFLFYGIWKRKKWAKIFNKKIISLSLLSLTPMIPILVYDFKNGFFQTIKFAGWLFFQALGSIGIKIIPQDPHPSWQSFFTFFSYEFRRIIFYRSEEISVIILFSVLLLNLILIYKLYKKKIFKTNYIVFYFTSIVLFSGFITQRESSSAYLTMLYPYIILLTALSVNALTQKKKIIAYGLLVLIFPILNSYYLFKEYRTSEGGGFNKLVKASEFIVEDSGGKNIVLERKNFKSNIEIYQYKYLVWWKGGKMTGEPEVEYGIFNASEGVPESFIYSDGNIYITKTEKHFIVLVK